MLRYLSTFILLFVIAEMALLITLGRYFGVFATIAIVLGGGVAGAWLARWQGLRTVLRARHRLASGVLPTVEMTDGLMIAVAAVLLILPGVLSDLLGLALLFPPTRTLLRRAVVAQFTRRSPLSRFTHAASDEASTKVAPRRDQIIDARVIETRIVED